MKSFKTPSLIDSKATVEQLSLELGEKRDFKTVTELPWSRDQESACQCRGHGFDPWFRKIPHKGKYT